MPNKPTKKTKAPVKPHKGKVGVSVGETQAEYRQRIMGMICSLISQKQVLTQICQLPDMPCYDTVYQWMNDSVELSDMYARARGRRAAARADRIDEITGMIIDGKLDPAAAKVVIDAEKWQASKENAKVYGDRITQEIEITDSLAEAMKSARERANRS